MPQSKERHREYMQKYRAKKKKSLFEKFKEKLKLEQKSDFNEKSKAIKPKSGPKEEDKPLWKGVGFDMWHGHEKEEQKLRDEERDEAILKEIMFSKPEPKEVEKYDWQQDLEQQIEKLSPKKSKKDNARTENENSD